MKKVVLWSSVVVCIASILTILYVLPSNSVKFDMELEVRPADVIYNDVMGWDRDFIVHMNRAFYASTKESDMDSAIDVMVEKSRDVDLYRIFGTSNHDEVKGIIKKRVLAAVDEVIEKLRCRGSMLNLNNLSIDHVEGSNRVRVSLVASADPKRVRRAFTLSARLEFWGVAHRDLAIRVRDIIAQSNMMEGIDVKMDEYYLDHGVLTANRSDIERINEVLRNPSNSEKLPFDVKLMWEHKSMSGDDNGEYRLVALDGYAPLMDGSGIVDVKVQSMDPRFGGGFEVSLTMDSASTRKWANITANHVGQQIAIVMDGVIYSAPYVASRIDDGATSITGNFTKEEAEYMALNLKTALPVPPHILSFKVIE